MGGTAIRAEHGEELSQEAVTMLGTLLPQQDTLTVARGRGSVQRKIFVSCHWRGLQKPT